MKNVMKDIFLKLMFNTLTDYLNFHNHLPFLLERMKIEKIEKLVASLHDKAEHVIYIRNLKPALNNY